MRRLAASWYGRAHPRRWLRLLRNAMLAMILVDGLLCLLVAYKAHDEINSATGNGTRAVAEVDAAVAQLSAADAAVTASLGTGDVGLVGPGASYSDDVTAVTQELVLAAEHNIAGETAADNIQFAEGLLVAYNDQVQQAITDYADNHSPALALAEVGSATVDAATDIQPALGDLRQAEQAAVTADLGSRWLGPGDFWWLLLAPFILMLVIGAATCYVLWHGFRRLFSVRLTAALGTTLLLIVLVATLNAYDGGRARAFAAPWIDRPLGSSGLYATGTGAAYSVPVLLAGLVLVAWGVVLAYAGYRPRLEEYRYQP